MLDHPNITVHKMTQTELGAVKDAVIAHPDINFWEYTT